MKKTLARLILVGALVSSWPWAAAAVATVQEEPHDYLVIEGSALTSTHALPFVLELPDRFEPRHDLDYRQVWNDIPFRVSVAIFEGEGDWVQVYAETLPEGHGRLDYSKLPPVEIGGETFHLRERCYDPAALEAEEIAAVPSRVALEEEGLTGVLVRQQYFLTSEDGLAELVLSYDREAKACEEGTEDFRAAASAEAETVFAKLRRVTESAPTAKP